MPHTTIHFNWYPKPGEMLSTNVELEHGGKFEDDFEIPAAAGELHFEVPSKQADRQAILLLPNCPLTVRTDLGQTFQITPANPLLWWEAHDVPCPLKGDISELIVSSAPQDAILQVRICKKKAAGTRSPSPAADPVSAAANSPLVLNAAT